MPRYDPGLVLRYSSLYEKIESDEKARLTPA